MWAPTARHRAQSHHHPTNTADINQLPRLLHGKEKEVFGDQAYWCEFHRQCAKEAGVRYRINRRGTRAKPLTEHRKGINRRSSKARARASTPFMW